MRSILRAFAVTLVVSVSALVSAAGCSSGGSAACVDACKATATCPGITIKGDVDEGCSALCALAVAQDGEKGCDAQHEALFDCQTTNGCDYTTKCTTEEDAYLTCASK
ncbi:Hypothetical protein A7982_07575 [Minicystis rosea]|nr:Hypothetical protein A7982_07575 [Minicystis rosea]